MDCYQFTPLSVRSLSKIAQFAKQRFARGEIDKTEFEERRQVLAEA
jgi:uncharacterized membrane protein